MTITHLLEERALQYADRTFVTCEDVEYSYQTMHERAGHVAANLAKHGVKPGEKIVLLMGNCMEFLYVFFGAGRIGGVVVPINPTLKPDEVAHIVNDSEAETIVTIPEFGPMLPQVKQLFPRVKRVFVVGEGAEGAQPFDALLEPVDDVPAIGGTGESEAALIYTSGTTGMPKGVILTHDNYLWNARMLTRSAWVSEKDCFFCVLPLFHVNAQVVSFLTPLTAGGSALLMRKFSPFSILPMIEKYHPTVLSAVPTIYNIMARMPKASEYDISSIRLLVSGAAPLPEATFELVQKVLKRTLTMGYGLSEATCASAVALPNDPIKWDSVGTVLPYTSVRIVDEEGVDVPYGTVGEILIAGPTVMRGYYKNPEATQQVLRDGWLYTGDLGRFDKEGYLYIVGRVKDMIIRGGQNIYPQQIEDVVSQVPGVEECCVVGVEEDRWGQEVLAVVKPAEEANLTEDQVFEYCRANLAQYKCPRFVRIVEELPKTATGKIKKTEVAAQYADIAHTA